MGWREMFKDDRQMCGGNRRITALNINNSVGSFFGCERNGVKGIVCMCVVSVGED